LSFKHQDLLSIILRGNLGAVVLLEMSGVNSSAIEQMSLDRVFIQVVEVEAECLENGADYFPVLIDYPHLDDVPRRTRPAADSLENLHSLQSAFLLCVVWALRLDDDRVVVLIVCNRKHLIPFNYLAHVHSTVEVQEVKFWLLRNVQVPYQLGIVIAFY